MGITEARGRLMERNSEDYVCPNCTGRKAQGSKPSTSTAGADIGKRPATPTTARKAESGPALVSQTNVPTPVAGLPPAAFSAATGSPAAEEKTGEEVGIKGRIEKATNPSGKKKIKIFQPVGCTVSVCLQTRGVTAVECEFGLMHKEISELPCTKPNEEKFQIN